MSRRGGYRLLSLWGLGSAITRGPWAVLKFFLYQAIFRTIFRALR